MSEYTDFLIVGGGISGLSLHWRLRSMGLKSILMDLPEQNRSTSIAAGLINPIAGKYYSLAWRADEFFKELERFYPILEKELNTQFFHRMPIERIFRTAGEQNQWLSKAHLPKYDGYCSFEKNEGYGKLIVHKGGWLNTSVFSSALQNRFRDEKTLRQVHFEHAKLDPDKRVYDGLNYGSVVFCEGKDMLGNPWFNELPLTPNKGEIMDIYCRDLEQETIRISGVFVLPLGDHLFRVGATYDHHDLSLEPTKEKKEELLSRLRFICSHPFKIMEHKVGIRPAVKDRRPLMGRHAEFTSMYIFNGLGSKGVSMSPLLSLEMMNYIRGIGSLHPDCNMNRFL